MCGLIGFFNNENAAELTAKGLQIIKERGKEVYGIATENELQIKEKPENLKLKNVTNPKHLYMYIQVST